MKFDLGSGSCSDLSRLVLRPFSTLFKFGSIAVCGGRIALAGSSIRLILGLVCLVSGFSREFEAIRSVIYLEEVVTRHLLI